MSPKISPQAAQSPVRPQPSPPAVSAPTRPVGHEVPVAASQTGPHGPLHASDILTLDVGGRLFKTTRATLCARPSKLASLARELPAGHAPDPRRSAFLDRDPQFFPSILGWLRDRQLTTNLPPTGQSLLKREAEFFGLDDLKAELKFIYPHKERQRLARGTSEHPLLYAQYAASVYGHGDRGRANGILLKARTIINGLSGVDAAWTKKGLIKLFYDKPNQPGGLVFPFLSQSFPSATDPDGLLLAESLFKAYPESILVSSLLADLLIKRRESERAFRIAKQAFEKNSHDLLTALTVGQVIYHRGDHATAIPFFLTARQSCTKKDAFREITALLASSLSRRSRHEEAVKMWQEVTKPWHRLHLDESLHEDFFNAFAAVGRLPEAAQWLEKLVLFRPTSRSFFTLSQIYFILAQLDNAFSAALKANELDPPQDLRDKIFSLLCAVNPGMMRS